MRNDVRDYGFGIFFIATPISQIATNQKNAFVVNKNAHGE